MDWDDGPPDDLEPDPFEPRCEAEARVMGGDLEPTWEETMFGLRPERHHDGVRSSIPYCLAPDYCWRCGRWMDIGLPWCLCEPCLVDVAEAEIVEFIADDPERPRVGYRRTWEGAQPPEPGLDRARYRIVDEVPECQLALFAGGP
jgi:hypothetical protein